MQESVTHALIEIPVDWHRNTRRDTRTDELLHKYVPKVFFVVQCAIMCVQATIYKF